MRRQLYVSVADSETWAAAEKQAAARQMSISRLTAVALAKELGLTPVAFYRLYMTDGTPLYYGISDDPKTRINTHKRSSFGHLIEDYRTKVEWYPNRDAAHEVELSRINSDDPIKNRDRGDKPEGFVRLHVLVTEEMVNAISQNAEDQRKSVHTFIAEALEAACSSPVTHSSGHSSSAFRPSSDSQRPALPTLIDPFGIRPATAISSPTSDLE